MAILVLGGIAFNDLEIPEKVAIPGDHKLVTHKLIGGQRVIDAMGPDPGEVSWSGRFRANDIDGVDVAAWAGQLEAKRDSGQPQTLVCGTITKTVLIKHFEWDYERPYQAAYTIKLEVVNSGHAVQQIQRAPQTVDTLIFADMQKVVLLAAIFPAPVII